MWNFIYADNDETDDYNGVRAILFSYIKLSLHKCPAWGPGSYHNVYPYHSDT